MSLSKYHEDKTHMHPSGRGRDAMKEKRQYRVYTMDKLKFIYYVITTAFELFNLDL